MIIPRVFKKYLASDFKRKSLIGKLGEYKPNKYDDALNLLDEMINANKEHLEKYAKPLQ